MSDTDSNWQSLLANKLRITTTRIVEALSDSNILGANSSGLIKSKYGRKGETLELPEVKVTDNRP